MNHTNARRHDEQNRQPASNPAKDPVCGMDVDPHRAKHRADHGGRTYYFCSAGCRERFEADPARFEVVSG